MVPSIGLSFFVFIFLYCPRARAGLSFERTCSASSRLDLDARGEGCPPTLSVCITAASRRAMTRCPVATIAAWAATVHLRRERQPHLRRGGNRALPPGRQPCICAWAASWRSAPAHLERHPDPDQPRRTAVLTYSRDPAVAKVGEALPAPRSRAVWPERGRWILAENVHGRYGWHTGVGIPAAESAPVLTRPESRRISYALWTIPHASRSKVPFAAPPSSFS
jgi:hypothetical protein